ncbi:glypican-5-like [Schistocerca nitens]|uniref:glypican-5-like n=1 Tax=Schistocerca nitens TaxID=7011 RepID=UPI00211921EA|nr:glypican-5-like [Schistocerca nitens]
MLDPPGVAGRELTVCVSEASCCTLEMEAALQRLVRRDFQALLHHNSRSLEGLLVSAANTIREHVLELLRQSENKTASLFEQQYRLISRQARDPVSALYATLGGHLEAPLQPSAGASAPGPAADLEEAVTDMFAGLFPLVYRHAVSKARDFAADYKACLREVTPELQPFGDAPRQLARSVQRALEAARVLRQALLLGAEVLNATDSLLTGENGPPGGAAAQAQCHAALLRMSYCSRCHGLQRRVRPCAGLCLNVLRGCLTQHAAELDLPWNGYVEAAERLVVAVQGHGAVDDVLRSLDGRITEAIMIAMVPAPNLEEKVKRSCGPHKWDESSPDSSQGEEEEVEAGEAAGGGGPRQLASGQSEVLGVTLTQGHITTGSGQDTLSSKLQHFLTSLTRSRGFYANLAESLCSDESFAETRDTADCWNGQRVGEYTKTVVASSVTAQKYNPELTWTPYNPDARIAELSDKLRHIKQVVVSQLTETPPALSFTHYEEGSGSGQEPGGGWDAEQDGGWRDDGSGSGDIPIGGGAGGVDTSSTDHAVHVSPGEGRDEKKADSGADTVFSCSLLLIVFGATAATSYIYDG